MCTWCGGGGVDEADKVGASSLTVIFLGFFFKRAAPCQNPPDTLLLNWTVGDGSQSWYQQVLGCRDCQKIAAPSQGQTEAFMHSTRLPY